MAGVSPVRVKEEPEWDNASETESNREYKVTSILELSPERIQPQDVAVSTPETSIKIEIEFVKQEQVPKELKEEDVKVPAFEDSTCLKLPRKRKKCGVKCKTCGKSFKCAILLDEHMVIHKKPHKKKQYACKICDKAFVYKSVFTKHKLVHKNDHKKTCLCVDCKPKSPKLTEKKKNPEPSLEKQYACRVCSKRFFNNFVLHIHEVTHTGKKPLFLKKILKKRKRRWGRAKKLDPVSK